MKISLVFGLALIAGLTVGCAGVRTSGNAYVAHGESFHLLGLKLPGDELDLARAQVPAGATSQTILAGPSDWTSVGGIVMNLMPGISMAIISGEKK